MGLLRPVDPAGGLRRNAPAAVCSLRSGGQDEGDAADPPGPQRRLAERPRTEPLRGYGYSSYHLSMILRATGAAAFEPAPPFSMKTIVVILGPSLGV